MNNKPFKQLYDEFISFIETYPPRKFSNSLRRMLIDYTAHGVTVGLPIHYDKFLLALYDLFELLDAAEEYREKTTLKKKRHK